MPEPSAAARRIELFYSYSHADEGLRDELQKHLSLLQRQGVIYQWHDRRIAPGAEWAGDIDRHLNTADIILLLVSADFLASEYCYEIEMTRALERHEAGEACVIPIILRSCDWSGAPFAKLQALPAEARPVASWSSRDEAFTDVAKGIRRAAQGLLGGEPSDAPAWGLHKLPGAAAPVVAKGLWSYDAHDAEFFLQMLPPPLDRGLPRSVRFWKDRIEQTDPDRTFRIGLMFGPSGCGKSSLVKAGLIPQLADSILPVYVEATPDDTEGRLLKALRKQLPDLAGNLSLEQSVSHLVENVELLGQRKLLLIVDQFEQWLHEHRAEQRTDLARALRLCDGGRVQCLLMIRVEFLLAAHRLADELDLDWQAGRNLALVDLFDPLHAGNVLTEFGRSYDRLPDDPAALTAEQNDFLDRAIAALADRDGRIVAVRLALFAEMVKGRPWTPATLREVGGAEGVGVAFLDEHFTRSTSAHRRHQKATMAVLKALLPESGSDIKGHMRSEDELRGAAGYPDDAFGKLMDILSSQLKLVTPATPEEADDEPRRDAPAADATGDGRFYQLTHDYLVPSIRRWVNVRLRQTWRGRAQLTLEQRTDQWMASKERRYLPGPIEFSHIMLGVPWNGYQPDQRSMMRAVGRWYGSIALVLLILLGVVGVVAREMHGRSQAPIIAGRLFDLNDDQGKEFERRLRDELIPYRRWVRDYLERFLSKPPAENPTESERVRAGRRRADAAIAMFALDAPESALDVLRVKEDPESLTQFAARCKSRGVKASQLLDELESAEDVSVRYGLLLSLGEFELEEIPEARRSVCLTKLAAWYAADPSSAVHGTCGWLLRQWGEKESVDKVDKVDRTPLAYAPGREWFVVEVKADNESPEEADYFTFVVFEPGEFQMGSPENEYRRYVDETLHSVRITRPFAICDREVTQVQYTRFADSLGIREEFDRSLSGMDLDDNVEYCRWLTSRRKGYKESDQCYVRLTGQTRSWQFHPSRPGFRLPTEAEWEYACRAGTVTRFSFGSDDDRLKRYGWFKGPTIQRYMGVGAIFRPNSRGLFDMHGHFWEWVHIREAEWPAKRLQGLVRGGGLDSPEAFCRSALRYYRDPRGNEPTSQYLGARVCFGGQYRSVTP